jgi:hypothetical protein
MNYLFGYGQIPWQIYVAMKEMDGS